MQRFEGKVALVTGAAGAIGKAIARELIDSGARAFLTDLNQDAVDSLVLVEPLNEGDHRFLAGLRRKVVLYRLHTHALAGAPLSLDVGGAGGVVTHQDDRQAGRALTSGDQLPDLFSHLLAELLGECEAVDDDGFDGF